VGKKRLERAMHMARDRFDFKVKWLPFLLNPKLPKEGINKREYYHKRFGNVEPIISRMKSVGDKEGIKFSYGGQIANTLNSHKLIDYSDKFGKQDAVVNILFRYYFEEEKNIGSVDILTAAAKEAGLDENKVSQYLKSDEGNDILLAQIERIQEEYGVSGVPFFIFNNKFSFSGAQEPETFLSVFEKVGQQ